jgi:Holliday junction resolvasome RuvABC endonuclease subunit
MFEYLLEIALHLRMHQMYDAMHRVLLVHNPNEVPLVVESYFVNEHNVLEGKLKIKLDMLMCKA